jgi:hypothetical protein
MDRVEITGRRPPRRSCRFSQFAAAPSCNRSRTVPRPREALESVALLAVGVAGIVAGARSLWQPEVLAPPPVVIAPPPEGWPAMHEPERVVRYTLKASLDPELHTVDGEGRIELKNVADAPLRDLRLHLYLNGFKNDATVFRRARVAGFRGEIAGAPGYVDVKKLALVGDGGAEEDLWAKHEVISHRGESPQDPLRAEDAPLVAGAPDDETDVRVPLPREVPPGATITLAVAFHDQLPEISERTGYRGSYHFIGQWFPKLAKLERDGTWAAFPFHHVAEFYADFGSYDVTIEAPERFVLGATGKAIEARREGGKRIERHVQDRVHDFAWTAWDRYVEREASEGPVAIKLLFPPGYQPAAERELQSARAGLRDLGARFGDYPYDVLTIVHPPDDASEAGGMEYPTLITTGGPWWPAHGSHEIEGVTVHELGHQWFYGLIATHEVQWPAGDEGLNSWAEQLVMRHLLGEGTAVSLGPFQLSYLAISQQGAAPRFDEPIFQPADRFANGASYGARVYGATAVALETLRRSYGEARFDAALGAYARKQRFSHPKPEDLFAALETWVSRDCAEAARAAMTTPTTLDFSVERVTAAKRHPPKGWFDKPDRVKDPPLAGFEGWSGSVWIARRGVVDLPVTVALRFADGSERREVVRFGDRPWLRVDADGPKELVSAVIDPDLAIPLDRDRTNNFLSTRRVGPASITRERATAWIGLAMRGAGW